MSLSKQFLHATVNGQQALAMSSDQRRRLALDSLQLLQSFNPDSTSAGETTLRNVLQPLFALSGYKLGAEVEAAQKVRFDLVGTNLLGGDDRILVDLKVTREKRRTLVPDAILGVVNQLPPSDPTRVILITPDGFERKIRDHIHATYGPRLELWDFDEVGTRLKSLAEIETSENLDAYAKLVLDFVEKLALAIARAQAQFHQIEWRELEKMIAFVLSELGYAVHLTESAKDGGRDIIVADFQADGLGVFNIEIKHWLTSQPGKKEVDRLLEVSMREKRAGALLLATSGVSPPAVQARGEIHSEYLRFGDQEKMVTTCRMFEQKKSGLWTGPRPFQTFAFDGTH